MHFILCILFCNFNFFPKKRFFFLDGNVNFSLVLHFSYINNIEIFDGYTLKHLVLINQLKLIDISASNYLTFVHPSPTMEANNYGKKMYVYFRTAE